jgi:alkyldihydroxyacetonephosphate synthase
MDAMKWWGWGREDVAFTHEDKPGLRPFVQRVLDVDVGRPGEPPVPFSAVHVPDSRIEPELVAALREAAGTEHVSFDAEDRVVHARGKSLRDLARHRAGDVGRVPDAVVRPGGIASCVPLT